MIAKNITQKRQSPKKNLSLQEKRTVDRRETPAEGYAYISIVGWISRREKVRRRNDPFLF